MFLPQLADAIASRARRHLQAGRRAEAIALASRYTRWRPTDPQGWILLAQLLTRSGHPDIHGAPFDPGGFPEAERVLDEGLRRCPDSVDIHLHLAKECLMYFDQTGEREKIRKAEKLYRAAMDRWPQAAGPYLGAADVAYRRRSWQEGLELLSRSVAKVSTTEDVSDAVWLLRSLAFVPDGRVEALQVARRFVKHFPENLYMNVVVARLAEQENPEEARDSLRRARESHSEEEIADTLRSLDEFLGKWHPDFPLDKPPAADSYPSK